MAEFGVKLKAPKGKRLLQELCQVSSPPQQQENHESGTNLEDVQSEEKTIPEQKTMQRVRSPEVMLNLDIVNHFNQLTSTDSNTQSKTDKARAKGQVNTKEESVRKEENEGKYESERKERNNSKDEERTSDVLLKSTFNQEDGEDGQRDNLSRERKNTFGVALKPYSAEFVDQKEGKHVLFRPYIVKEIQSHPVENSDGSSDEEEKVVTLQRTRTILAASKRYEAVDRKKSVSRDRDEFKHPRIQEESAPGEEIVPESTSKREKREIKCWHAVQEIMSSEKSYVNVLFILDEFKKRVESEIPRTSEEGCHIFQISLFSILPSLLMLNTHLLEEFEERIAHWNTHKKIADVLVKKGNFLRIYSTYSDTFEKTSSIFEDCIRKYQSFAKIVKEVQSLPLCQGLGLQMHLLAPVQRLPRYKMLLETYLKYQEEDAEDYEDTKDAIRIVSSVTTDSNKWLHEKEMREKMKVLQERVGPGFELIQAARSLLKEGMLDNVTLWEVPQPCHAILVTDSLLVACHKVIKDQIYFCVSLTL